MNERTGLDLCEAFYILRLGGRNMSLKLYLSAAASMVVVQSSAVAAQEGAEKVSAASAFGAREDIMDVSLSPDGQRLAIVRAVPTRGQAVMVVGIDGTNSKVILAANGNPDRLRGCRWSAASRLVCTYVLRNDGGDGPLLFSRMVAIDADGGNMKLLSARTNIRALGVAQNGGEVIDWLGGDAGKADGRNVLMTRMLVPEQTTGTHTADSREGVAVERVDTLTLKRTLVEPPRGRSAEFITDGHGVVRVMGVQPPGSYGYNASRISYSYRKAGTRDWTPLSTLMLVASGTTGFNPVAVDPDLDVVYGFEPKDGRQALYRILLDGSMKRELVYANPDVDVDGLIRIGRQNRVVGASYATDKRYTIFFDPELKTLARSLSRAIPNLPLITFVDASADEKKLVLFAGSDVDPGKYYIYDKTSREMAEILPVRPQLGKTTLSPVKPVSYAAADGTQVPGYLTLPAGSSGKGLPAIVLPHGGPGARDEWGFDWLAQYFASRGYAVLQPNFRGSAGYGDAWFQNNGFQSWRVAVGDVNDGGRWLLSQGIAAPGKLAVLGWSYGGYAALQSPALDPDLFKAIVAIAPVTDLETLRSEARNFTNFPQVDAFIGHGDHVRAGSPAQNVTAIRAPVLLFHGDWDANVGVGESRMMASRLRGAGKSVEYVELPKLDHQLADDAARADMLERSDAFIARAIGK
ncbi:alpha/beta hydrolase family protein [Sphingomonas sp. 1P08PE]|uniref:alpha/beta hydrolase family protein n=1 Tax=Sphingomonas sp. 1P08PE TaxID=554122 RepID=UPI0039A2106C